MFLEPQLNDYETGWIEVICGSMFSGKTEELIRRLKRAKFANMKVEIFKPLVDNRYHEERIGVELRRFHAGGDAGVDTSRDLFEPPG